MVVFSKTFNALNTVELYQILKLRTDVFVVEQHCAYPELDDYDMEAQHIFGVSEEGNLVGYARLLAQDTVYTQCSIGRVCVHKNHRGQKIGQQIFEKAVAEADRLYPSEPLKIQAQTYLEDWYQSFGFKTVTEPYLDFGIAHVDMVRG